MSLKILYFLNMKYDKQYILRCFNNISMKTFSKTSPISALISHHVEIL